VVLLREIDELARRSRIDLGVDAVAPQGPSAGAGAPVLIGSGLTKREREVLLLLAEGRTNREIGEQLFITEKTAGVHVSNILGKLGAARRTEAVAIARKAGLD